jgi:hypothetical protein
MDSKVGNVVASSLLALLMTGLPGCDEVRGDRGEKVGIDQLPPAVKATLDQESKGATVKEVEKTDRDGKTVYSAEVMVKGKEQKMLIAEDGTIVTRQTREEDDEDDDEDEDKDTNKGKS